MLMLMMMTYTYFLLEWTASSLDWTATEMEGPWFCVWTKVRMSWLSTEDYGGRRWMSTRPMLVGTSTLTTQEFFATRLLNVRRRKIYTCVREGGAI